MGMLRTLVEALVHHAAIRLAQRTKTSMECLARVMLLGEQCVVRQLKLDTYPAQAMLEETQDRACQARDNYRRSDLSSLAGRCDVACSYCPHRMECAAYQAYDKATTRLGQQRIAEVNLTQAEMELARAVRELKRR